MMCCGCSLLLGGGDGVYPGGYGLFLEELVEFFDYYYCLFHLLLGRFLAMVVPRGWYKGMVLQLLCLDGLRSVFMVVVALVVGLAALCIVGFS